jgi:hypothetical protein
LVYVLNLALYAIPLTAAGFGRQNIPSVPDWFGSALLVIQIAGNESIQSIWSFTYSFVQNSLSILGATVLTLITFHVGLVLTNQSRGIIETAYSVIYSTSVYLAGIFSVVWYLSLSDGVEVARTFVIDLQRAFVYTIIDLFDANVGLPSGRPGSLELGPISTQGELLLSLLLALVVYYLYSLFLGARINHETPRTYSCLVIIFVATSPIIYISAVVFLFITPLGIL